LDNSVSFPDTSALTLSAFGLPGSRAAGAPRVLNLGLVMKDRIARVVDKAIDYAEEVLANEIVSWPVAREGLTRLLASLKSQAPDHPSVDRLRRFIAAQGRVHDEIGLRH
jgi:hypothetical protein